MYLNFRSDRSESASGFQIHYDGTLSGEKAQLNHELTYRSSCQSSIVFKRIGSRVGRSGGSRISQREPAPEKLMKTYHSARLLPKHAWKWKKFDLEVRGKSLPPHGSANGLECSMPIVFNCDSEFPVFFRNFYLNLHKKTKGLFTCTVSVPVSITITIKVHHYVNGDDLFVE